MHPNPLMAFRGKRRYCNNAKPNNNEAAYQTLA
jgi:hypothetical protein